MVRRPSVICTLKELVILLIKCIIEKHLWIFLHVFLFDSVAFLFKELDPEKFIHFKDKIVIRKLDARKYEESLKAELTSWVKNGHAEEVIFTFFFFFFWQNPMFFVFLTFVAIAIIIIITVTVLVFNVYFRVFC